MKKILLGFLLIISVFSISQAFIMKSTNETEKYDYKVLKKYENFEIRKYEKANFSYIKMDAKSYNESSNYGFKILAGYIFGNNNTNEKIAMTSPVAMNMDDTITMMFMIPSNYQLSDLPTPNDGKVQFKTEPEKIVAAITFGGWADDEKIEKYANRLKNELQLHNITHYNNYSFFGYNPPYDVINRKNEIVIEINPKGIEGIYY